ncbi:hypothetical protein ElyMa_001365400 [Elysia marginata]|uniref:Uncharacterized protein n=1 Tax=Elysia marginata TaxID=1093978 RepID=A0AAV4ING6_9GAST|nr:hypothetical protein ElyMa_001365400 [Elysia marginata]
MSTIKNHKSSKRVPNTLYSANLLNSQSSGCGQSSCSRRSFTAYDSLRLFLHSSQAKKSVWRTFPDMLVQGLNPRSLGTQRRVSTTRPRRYPIQHDVAENLLEMLWQDLLYDVIVVTYS